MAIMQVVKERELKYPETSKMWGATFIKTPKNKVYMVVRTKEVNNRCAYKVIPLIEEKQTFEHILKVYSKDELLEMGEIYTSTDKKDSKILIKELLEL